MLDSSKASTESKLLKNSKKDGLQNGYSLSTSSESKVKSLTRPERNDLDNPNNPNFYYAQKVKENSNAYVLPSSTGFNPLVSTSNNLSSKIKNNHSNNNKNTDKFGRSDSLWIFYTYLVTFWAPSKLLKKFGFKNKDREMAWREKIALISLIIYSGIFVAFLTFGFNTIFCKPQNLVDVSYTDLTQEQSLIHGYVYKSEDIQKFGIKDIGNKDLSFMFQNVEGNCKSVFENDNKDYFLKNGYYSCSESYNEESLYKHFCTPTSMDKNKIIDIHPQGRLKYTWDDVKNLKNQNLVVYDGNVIDIKLLDMLDKVNIKNYPQEYKILTERGFEGTDITYLFSDYQRGQTLGKCLVQIAKIGTVDSETVGCVTSKVVLSISLTLIIGIIFIKFLGALVYAWLVVPQQGIDHIAEDFYKQQSSVNYLENLTTTTCTSVVIQDYQKKIKNKSDMWFNETLNPKFIHKDVLKQPHPGYMPYGYPLLHTICFVTCYSESKEAIKGTLDSICHTDYPDTHKLLMIVCDGLIKGSGNEKTTPELVLELIDDFSLNPDNVEAHSYVAVAYGEKRHNKAKVYSGFYTYSIESEDETISQATKYIICKVPIICVVKCGTEQEQKTSSKPGNRGKRDSQIILMSFLEKMFFNDRMSQLEYQLLKNIWMITGLMAKSYELVLTVDADTVVSKDSLGHMATEMCKDPKIMGLCGETRISNKMTSWVTAIQVFEYFISHHQSKAFESLFGTVTCLPGCFSIYRIKAPRLDSGFWVPILANPDITERYSDNITNTLHKKNLLHLGEDRYLTSLLLKTFPKRKLVFLSKAFCQTLVPDTFSILLSQRRRWINSTIHNLMELLLINDLCGIFCFSMQFLIFIELIGSVLLPLAIVFTLYIIFLSIFSSPTPYATLILLAIILGLPGFLILLIGKEIYNFVYMIIYIVALPIWNFVLPVYAFWKFDDFSWGETRVVEGDTKHEDEVGEFDYSQIYMRDWKEIAREDVAV